MLGTGNSNNSNSDFVGVSNCSTELMCYIHTLLKGIFRSHPGIFNFKFNFKFNFNLKFDLKLKISSLSDSCVIFCFIFTNIDLLTCSFIDQMKLKLLTFLYCWINHEPSSLPSYLSSTFFVSISSHAYFYFLAGEFIHWGVDAMITQLNTTTKNVPLGVSEVSE